MCQYCGDIIGMANLVSGFTWDEVNYVLCPACALKKEHRGD